MKFLSRFGRMLHAPTRFSVGTTEAIARPSGNNYKNVNMYLATVPAMMTSANTKGH
jgi:hypothetical protein